MITWLLYTVFKLRRRRAKITPERQIVGTISTAVLWDKALSIDEVMTLHGVDS